jgi:hypothetical protein
MKDAKGHGSNARGAAQKVGIARTARGLSLAAQERIHLRQMVDARRFGMRKFGTLDAGRIEDVSAHLAATHDATKNKSL